MISKNIRFNQKNCVNILFYLLMFLTFFRYGIQINIPDKILISISLLIITLGNKNEIITMCLICIPLHTSYNYLYTILYGSLVLFVKNINKIKVNYIFFIFLFLFIWELLHSFFGSFNVIQLTTSFLPLILILVLYFCCDKNIDYQYISLWVVRFTILVGVNLIARYLTSNSGNFIYALEQIGRLGTIAGDSDISGGQINPNSYGAICVLAITIIMQNIIYIKKSKIYFLYLIILIILGMLTLSRTFFVLLLFMYILFFIDYKGSSFKKIKIFCTLLLIVTIVSAVLIIFFPNVLETFINRWKDVDISNGRISIMIESMNCIFNTPFILFFGIGMQDYKTKVAQYVFHPPHDFITETLMILGIPGAIAFIVFVSSIFLKSKQRNRNIAFVNWIPFFILVVKSCAGHLLTSGYSMLTLSLIYINLIYDFKLKKEV